MKKILNQPDHFVDEMVEGILLAHPSQLKTPGEDPRILVRADAPVAGKVGIVTGGGSGHLPLFKGYVGQGLCDGVAIGNVFSSPSSQQCFEATVAVNGGAGVLPLRQLRRGRLQLRPRRRPGRARGHPTRTVLGRDDVASQPKERKTDRRGVAGIFFAYKAAGAAASGATTWSTSRPQRRTWWNTPPRWASACRRRYFRRPAPRASICSTGKWRSGSASAGARHPPRPRDRPYRFVWSERLACFIPAGSRSNGISLQLPPWGI